MAELWLVETASEFWEMAGGFFADFEAALAFALPVTVVRIDSLTIASVDQWLAQRSIILQGLAQLANRPLRACLVALGGVHNFVLLDAKDSPTEQLFSLAHEIAHFLLDYLQPRRLVKTRLSSAALEILDGVRQPTLAERLDALLAGIKLQPHRHFMERDGQGDILSGHILTAESRADQLALELLAPHEQALSLVQHAIINRPDYAARLKAAQAGLLEKFNLPSAAAKVYAKQLVHEAGGAQTFMEWLSP